MSRDGDRDAEQNPYRSPRCLDETQAAGPGRQRSRDLRQAGMFLGIAHGAAAGAAVTVCLDVVAGLVELAAGSPTSATIDGLGMVITSLIAVAMFGALVGALSGANLGFLQGVWTARAVAGRGLRLVRRAALCWALIAVAWCLLIDLQTVSRGPRWIMYLALLVAPAAAGFAGAQVAVQLARLRPVSERWAESWGQNEAGNS
jgi:hypothetical protein